MAQVEIEINGREYRVTCEDGQEDRLRKLSNYFDDQVDRMADELGQIGDARLMLLAALTICDELFEAKARVSDLDEAGEKLDPETEGAASKAIEAAVTRVQDVAERLAARG